jgi:hypothetical protein
VAARRATSPGSGEATQNPQNHFRGVKKFHQQKRGLNNQEVDLNNTSKLIYFVIFLVISASWQSPTKAARKSIYGRW